MVHRGNQHSQLRQSQLTMNIPSHFSCFWEDSGKLCNIQNVSRSKSHFVAQISRHHPSESLSGSWRLTSRNIMFSMVRAGTQVFFRHGLWLQQVFTSPKVVSRPNVCRYEPAIDLSFLNMSNMKVNSACCHWGQEICSLSILFCPDVFFDQMRLFLCY